MCNSKSVRNESLQRCRNFRLFSSATGNWNYRVFEMNGIINVDFWKMKNRGAIFSASGGQNSSVDMGRKRKVVEHVCLLKAKEDLSDEKEKDMMDYLYTSQYQMGGIVAVSIGRISDRNLDNYTHAFYMRFQTKEALAKFYNNTFYLGVLKDRVMPYCHGLINLDYESEVEDDILAIFRKGEEFNFGVEFVVFIEFVESALGRPVEDALASLAKLTMEFPSLIVQATQGVTKLRSSNFNVTTKEYTHGVVIRFRSLEAFEIFMSSSEYKDETINPVGTEIIDFGKRHSCSGKLHFGILPNALLTARRIETIGVQTIISNL
ncbi:unnamed protein product [Camellia sinensis]